MKKLTTQQIEHFKNLFLQRQQLIIQSHMNDQEEIDVDGGDEVDIVQGIVLKNLADSLSQRDVESLARIKEALLRIDNGTFGLCEECEEPIPEKRLLALPDCKACISCAEEQERIERQYVHRAG
jgi:RNA polymerase-binding protein DksA